MEKWKRGESSAAPCTLSADQTGPAASGSCSHDFPIMTQWPQGQWSEINTSDLALLLSSYFVVATEETTNSFDLRFDKIVSANICPYAHSSWLALQFATQLLVVQLPSLYMLWKDKFRTEQRSGHSVWWQNKQKPKNKTITTKKNLAISHRG